MTATPYSPQSWSDNEPLLVEKLNAMTNNDQYLFEQQPKVYFNAHGHKKTAGIRIMTGAVSIPAKASTGSMNTFYFGSFFSSGCKPIVVASLTVAAAPRAHVVTRGIGTLWPDHRGFQAFVYADDLNPKNNVIRTGVWVSFIAIGW